MRLEECFARWMAFYFNSNTKNGGKKLTDFMPHFKERELTPEEAMKEWS